MTDSSLNSDMTHLPAKFALDGLWLLTLLTCSAVLLGVYLALIHAPLENMQGAVQRIFYLHLAAFGGALVGFSASVIGGVAYLLTRHTRWDALSLAGAEVGLVLAAINITTGMIYARPIINAWWTWDPKLTAVAVMALTYASYAMLRNAVEPSERQRVFAAVYSLLAFATVIHTILAIRIRNDVLHEVMFGGSGTAWMPDAMQVALYGNLLIWALLVAPTLIGWRMRLEKRYRQREWLRAQIADH